MNVACIIGSAINYQGGRGPSFDAFASDPERGLLILSDGANSCPASGRTARWLCEASLHALAREGEQLDLEVWLRGAHAHILQHFDESAATWLALQAGTSQLRVAGVGDSLLRVYERAWRGWGRWQLALELARDRDASGRVRQLVGSEVLEDVHVHTLARRGRQLVLMMTDGVADSLRGPEIDEALRTLGRHAPSREDLDYLCASLADQAIALGCQDDVSVALAWIGPID